MIALLVVGLLGLCIAVGWGVAEVIDRAGLHAPSMLQRVFGSALVKKTVRIVPLVLATVIVGHYWLSFVNSTTEYQYPFPLWLVFAGGGVLCLMMIGAAVAVFTNRNIHNVQSGLVIDHRERPSYHGGFLQHVGHSTFYYELLISDGEHCGWISPDDVSAYARYPIGHRYPEDPVAVPTQDEMLKKLGLR